MPHIHTEPGQYDMTVSAYIVRTDTPEPALVLHRHRTLGVYLQFGGHIELLENPWQALKHELAEESGYSIDELNILQPRPRLKKLTGVQMHPVPVTLLTHLFPGLNHYHTTLDYAFTTNSAPQAAVADGESTDIRLFTAQELRALPARDIPENVREIGLFILKDCLVNWEAMPATLFSVAQPE